ncbi:MAG TPA: TlpA disulfide reductase family protein [Pseudomonadota bacterium]|nr:TlpA disulfide reductase family protein [Pseudomonadota bacterium]
MMKTALCLVLLIAGPSLASAATGGVAADGDRGSAQDEFYLLNHRVAMPSLVVWDGAKREWRAPLGNEGDGPSAQIRLVHLWGTYCQPCEEEFPVLKQMDLQLRKDYKGAVQFVYIADALSSAAEMRKFMDKNHTNMPLGLLYRDGDNKLSADLLSVLPQRGAVAGAADAPSERQLRLPLTLVLDADNVVRLAFVGTVLNRRAAIVNGIAQLSRTLSGDNAPGKAKLAAKKGRSLQ